MQPNGGYKSVSVIQFCNGIAAYDAGTISFRALRVYFAAFAVVAAREAARRTVGPRERRRSAGVRYRLQEFERLTGIAVGEVRGLLRRLERAGLLAFSESAITVSSDPTPGAGVLAELVAGRGRSGRRYVPVPRPVLRLLARSTRPAFAKTIVGYLIRGLAIDRRTGEVKAKGSVKVTWIARAFNVSERAVRYARRELLRLGLITPDAGSSQRKLNRDGAYFTVNAAWGGSLTTAEPAESAPPAAQNAAQNAPPYQDMKTSSELKDRTTRQREAAGVCGRGASSPSLNAIRPDDLRRVSSVLALYEQAVGARWLERTDASRRNFVAAAVRAAQIDGDPARVFVAIVRRGLWHHITQSQEDKAVRALKSFASRAGRRAAATPAEGAGGDPGLVGRVRGILAAAVLAVSARSSVLNRRVEATDTRHRLMPGHAQGVGQWRGDPVDTSV